MNATFAHLPIASLHTDVEARSSHPRLYDGLPMTCLVDALPSEILSEIFAYHASLNKSPRHLTLVSQRWRRVALGTPELWTRIIVSDGDLLRPSWWNTEHKPHWKGRAFICYDIQVLKDVINRTGVFSLDIHIEFASCGYNGVQKLVVQDTLDGVLTTLLEPKVAGRITDLRVSIIGGMGDYMPLETFVHHHPPFGSLSSLHTLRIHSMPPLWLDRLLEDVSVASAHSLRFIEFDDNHVGQRIIPIIPRLTRLERLDLWYWPDERTPDTISLCLTKLDLHCSPRNLARIPLPRLKFLRIDTSHTVAMWGSRQMEPGFSLYMPELTELYAVTEFAAWMKCIVAPKLRVLRVNWLPSLSWLNQQNHTFSFGLFPTVENFRMTWKVNTSNEVDELDDYTPHLIAALRAVPNATKVMVILDRGVYVSEKVTLRIPLLERLGSIEADQVLCPRVSELSLVANDRRDPDLFEDEKALIRRLIEVRKQSGRELSVFEVGYLRQDGENVFQRLV